MIRGARKRQKDYVVLNIQHSASSVNGSRRWGHLWGHNSPKPRRQMQSGADAGSHRRRSCNDLRNHAERRKRPNLLFETGAFNHSATHPSSTARES